MRFGRLCVASCGEGRLPARRVRHQCIWSSQCQPTRAGQGLASEARFEECDASKNLPFDDNTFDAVFSNDVLCHLPGRPEVLGEMFRILKPGGRMLFSDALIVGGLLSNEEIAIRSSIGFYVYSPPGENERLTERAGFRLVRVTDTTGTATRLAKQWHDARKKRKEELVAAEGSINFEGLQRFLSCVHTLTGEQAPAEEFTCISRIRTREPISR